MKILLYITAGCLLFLLFVFVLMRSKPKPPAVPSIPGELWFNTYEDAIRFAMESRVPCAFEWDPEIRKYRLCLPSTRT